jgi:hypothetical protein
MDQLFNNQVFPPEADANIADVWLIENVWKI